MWAVPLLVYKGLANVTISNIKIVMMNDKVPRQCKKIKPDGTRCRAYAMTGSPLCFFHNPEMKDERIESQKKGGQNRRKHQVVDSNVYQISTSSDIQKLLQKVANDLLTGTITSSEARAVVYLCKLARQIKYDFDFEI